MVKIGDLNALGEELKAVRQVKGLSRHAVAQPAKISAAYLQKLEAGEARNPSPRILHRLAGVLQVSYGTLMELAGYAVPSAENTGEGAAENAALPDSASPLRQALQAEQLSDDELRAVAAFVAYLKAQRRRD